MKLNDLKLILIATGIIGILLIASPTIAGLISLPQGEQFSELYLLGPQHMAEGYPYNIVPNQNYSIYVDVGNHMGTLAYYVIYVKFQNASDILPDATQGKTSSTQPLYEYRFAVQNGQTVENLLTFSITDTYTSNNQTTIGNIHLNNQDININKPSTWNSTTTTCQYNLLLELWIYNGQSGNIEFNNRYVNLQLNCTTMA